MTVKLPGLRSATEDGKRPVIAGGLQRTGPDDGAGAPRAMQKGCAAGFFQRVHVGQQQAVRQALRRGKGEFSIFSRWPHIQKKAVSPAFEIGGRRDFRQPAPMGDNFAKRL